MELNTYVIIAIIFFIIAAISLIISIIIFVQDDILNVYNEYSGKTKERGIQAIKEGKQVHRKTNNNPVQQSNQDTGNKSKMSEEARKAKAYAHSSKRLNSDDISEELFDESGYTKNIGETVDKTDVLKKAVKSYTFDSENIDTTVLSTFQNNKNEIQQHVEFANTSLLSKTIENNKETADTTVLTKTQEVSTETADTTVLAKPEKMNLENVGTTLLTKTQEVSKETADTAVLAKPEEMNLENVGTTLLTKTQEVSTETVDTAVLAKPEEMNLENIGTTTLSNYCGETTVLNDMNPLHEDVSQENDSTFKVVRTIIVVHSKEIVSVTK